MYPENQDYRCSFKVITDCFFIGKGLFVVSISYVSYAGYRGCKIILDYYKVVILKLVIDKEVSTVQDVQEELVILFILILFLQLDSFFNRMHSYCSCSYLTSFLHCYNFPFASFTII